MPVARRRLFLLPYIFLLLGAGSASGKPSETFSIDYVVTISAEKPEIATVRWELAGIDEVKEFRLRFAPDRLGSFRGTGTLEPIRDGLRWVPGGPYAHLSYRVRINHVRGQHQRYDSYAGSDWIVTRAHDLFPRIAIDCQPRDGMEPKSRARLIFRLPAGWHSAAALPALAPDVYRLSDPGKVLDRPRGWFMLGRFALDRQEIGGTMLQVARVPGPGVTATDLFRFLDATLPALKRLLAADTDAIFVAIAPDPMWHGGISGERSFYMHAKRPLRTPDKTSPYLHEMFHVLQPYKPGPDADWIEEGLAEYYSIELQRRAGSVEPAAYARALAYFERFGLWNVDMTQQQDNAATNNSAPLIMYALDQRIQHATAGKRRLDDVVTRLAQHPGKVDTALFLRSVNEVAGKTFTKFFARHVLQGVPPNVASAR